jgi:hypothetical protein
VRRALVASVLVTAGCDQGAKATADREQVGNPTGGGGPDPVPPQVAYANGFTLEVVDEADKPVAGVKMKVTLDRGGSHEVTTSERGDVYITDRVEGSERVTVEAPGYERVPYASFEGGMSPWVRVVLKKQRVKP